MAITKRKDSSRRPFKVSWRDPDGRQRSKSFRTRREAQQFHAQVVQAKAIGASGPAEPSRITVADWLERWFRSYSPEWAATTSRHRAYICDKWVVPYIGSYRLGQLNAATIRDYRARILNDGSTDKNANAVMRVLSAALGAAVESELMQANPCGSVRNLRVAKPQPRALTPTQVEQIRANLPADRDRMVVSLMAYAGLRPGEVCALRWDHVRNHILLVEQSAQYGKIIATKTGRSRAVAISDALAEDLAAAERTSEYVAPGDRGGILDWHNWSGRAWRPVVRALGIDAVPYDLRHTFASLALHEGRSLAWVAAAMGHANQTTTLDHYSHLYQESQLATRLPMSDAIRGARAALAAR